MKSSLQIIMDGRSRKTVIIVSAVLLVLGLIGIVLPQFMSMAVAWFIGWLMLFGSGIAFYIAWLGFRGHWLVWLKPFVLAVVGLMILLNPVAGAAALGLMLAIYFLFDGFAGISFSLDLKPQRGWVWLMFNGVLSLRTCGRDYSGLADHCCVAGGAVDWYQSVFRWPVTVDAGACRHATLIHEIY